MIKLPKILPKPVLPANISYDAKWLSGEGAGSWFKFDVVSGDLYKVFRYSPVGTVECEGIYQPDKEFHLSLPYSLTYPCNCSVLSVIQGNEKITLLPIKSFKKGVSEE